MAKEKWEESPDAFEREIMLEKCEALGSSGIRLEGSIEKLEEIAGRIYQTLQNGVSIETEEQKQELTQLLRAYRQQRKKALEEQRKLIIHREALGFRHHNYVYEFYSIPESSPEIDIIDQVISGKGGRP